jgi:uncharacterized membrane protein YfhO
MDMKQGVWIYQNPNALPRAYVVHHMQVASDEQALAVLNASDFSPYKTVLLSTPLSEAEMASLAPTPVRATERAEITRYDLHRVDVKVNLGSPGMLVLSDNYYPGWHVSVDGVPAPLLRVNTTFRGVYLPSGAHQVTFDFVPVVLYVGLAFALLTLMVAVLVTALALRRPSVLQ